MSLKKKFEKVFNSLQRWPVEVSTPQLIQDIEEVVKDLQDDPIRLYNVINFIKDNSQKYPNKNLVEVFSKSLLGNFIKDSRESEKFYNNHIKNNFIYWPFYRIGNHLLENRLVFYSVEDDALIALRQALDDIVEKNPHLRLLEELEKLEVSTTESTQVNFNINSRLKLLLLSSLSLSQISGARAQQSSTGETCAISVANGQPVLNEFTFQCPNNITLYEKWESFSEYLNIDNNFGNPLHLAARLNFPEFLGGFLKVYSDVINVRDAELRTPLHLASGSGAVDTVNYLLTHGADINAEDKAGYTALHWAASKGNLEIVKILLSHSPAIKGAGDEGITPFTIAIGRKFYDIAQLLLDFRKTETKIDRNWYRNIEEALRYLEKKQYSEVLQALNKFLEVKPTNDEERTNEEGKFWASMLLKRSEMNFNLNNIDQALQDVERSIELYPSRVVIAHYWRIKLLFAQEKFNFALDAIEEGLSFFPSDRLLLGDRITALINLRRYGEALTFATELIQRFPAEAFSYKKLGDVYFRQKSYPPFQGYRKALENYEKAFSLSHEDVSYKELIQAAGYLANPNNAPIYLHNHQAEFSVEDTVKNKPSQALTEYFYGSEVDSLAREMLMSEGELAECIYKTDEYPNMQRVRELHKNALENFKNDNSAEAIKKLEYALVLIPSIVMEDPCINSYLAAVFAQLARGYELEKNYSATLDAFRYVLYLKPLMTQEEKDRAIKKYQWLLNLAKSIKPMDEVVVKKRSVFAMERLFFAAANNDEKSLRQLIQQKLDLNSKDERGNTPLIAAVKQNSLKTLKMLVNAGADPKMKNTAGETALHQACLKGNTEAIEILADAKTDLQVADAAKKTPFAITIDRGDKLAAKMLFKKISGEELPDEIFEKLYEVKKSIFSDLQSLKRLTEVITWLQARQNSLLNKMLKQCFKDRAELQLQLKNEVAYHQDFLSSLELGDEEKELKVFVKHLSRMEWGGKVVLEAVKILDKGLQLFPDNDELLTYRIEQLSVQKKYSETITLCAELVNKGTNLPLPHFYLSHDCVNRGDYSGLKQYIQRILLNPLLYKAVVNNNIYARAFAELQYAEQFLNQNNLQDFLRSNRGSFAKKVELSKKLAFLQVIFRPSLLPGELVNNLRDNIINSTEINDATKTVYFKLKTEINTDWVRREETLKFIIKKLEETNDMYYSPALSFAYGNLGTAYFELNRTTEAKEAFENAIILGSPEAIVYFRHGNILFKEGNFNDAHIAFKKACELDPKNLRFKERLNEVVQKQENSFIARNAENEPVLQQKIEVKPQGSWFFRIVAVIFAASITYYFWRRETKAQEERLRRFFQKDVLPVLNSLTSTFYESSWETVGTDKLKLKNKPKLSIETSRLKNKGFLSGTSKFTINSDILHIAIHESLNKILYPEDVSYNKDTAEFIVAVKHINLKLFKNKDIQNIIDAIIITLSENSLELANIKLELENTKQMEKFKNLFSRIKEHKNKYLNSQKIKELLEDRKKFTKEIGEYKAQTEDKYDEKESLIKFKKESCELSKLKKRIIAKSSELIGKINNFTEAKIAAFDNGEKNESVGKEKTVNDKKHKRYSRNSGKEVDENVKEGETKKPSAAPEDIPANYEACCELLISEYAKYEKSEAYKPIDIDKIEKVLDKADQCYKGSLFQKLYDLYEQKLSIEVGLAEYQKAASELPQLKPAPQPAPKSPEPNHELESESETETETPVVEDEALVEGVEESTKEIEQQTENTQTEPEEQKQALPIKESKEPVKEKDVEKEIKQQTEITQVEPKEEQKLELPVKESKEPAKEKEIEVEGTLYIKEMNDDVFVKKKKHSSTFFGNDPKNSFFVLLGHQVLRIENLHNQIDPKNEKKKKELNIENDLDSCIASHALLYCLLRMLEAFKNQLKNKIGKNSDIFRILRNMIIHIILVPALSEIMVISKIINTDWKEKILRYTKYGHPLDIDELTQTFKNSNFNKFYQENKSVDKKPKSDENYLQAMLGNIFDLTRIVKEGWDEVTLRENPERFDAASHCVAMIGYYARKLVKGKFLQSYNKLKENKSMRIVISECQSVKVIVGHYAQLQPSIGITKVAMGCRNILKDLPEPLKPYEKLISNVKIDQKVVVNKSTNIVDFLYENINNLTEGIKDILTSALTREDLLSEDDSKFSDVLRTAIKVICQRQDLSENDQKFMKHIVGILYTKEFNLDDMKAIDYRAFRFKSNQFHEICHLIKNSSSKMSFGT